MTDLNLLTLDDLKKLCKISHIKYQSDTQKSQLIKLLKKEFKQIDKQTFTKLRKLGVPGKEGTVWAIKYKTNPKEYALKQFKNTKSGKEIIRESELQKIASRGGISPKIVEVDILAKFIIMDLVPGDTLFDILNKSNGVMTISEQKNFVDIIDKLDKIGIYHGDPSPLNFIYDEKKKMKVIDFGFAKRMEKGENLNKKNMLLGFILQMKNLGVDIDKNYTYIKQRIEKKDLEKCGLS